MTANKNLEMEALIIRMDRVPYIDQSGLYALENVLFNLKVKNITAILVGLQPQPKDILELIGIIPNLVPEENISEDIGDAAELLKILLKNHRNTEQLVEILGTN